MERKRNNLFSLSTLALTSGKVQSEGRVQSCSEEEIQTEEEEEGQRRRAGEVSSLTASIMCP